MQEALLIDINFVPLEWVAAPCDLGLLGVVSCDRISCGQTQRSERPDRVSGRCRSHKRAFRIAALGFKRNRDSAVRSPDWNQVPGKACAVDIRKPFRLAS